MNVYQICHALRIFFYISHALRIRLNTFVMLKNYEIVTAIRKVCGEIKVLESFSVHDKNKILKIRVKRH